MMGTGKYQHVKVTKHDGTVFDSENEPLFVLRGQDRHTPETIHFYASLVEQLSPVDAEDLRKFAEHIRKWQSMYPDKVKDPD